MASTWAGVTAELDELDSPIEEVFLIAEVSGSVVGALGVDLDRPTSSAWLLGPFCNSSSPAEINESLLREAHARMPAWVKHVRQYLDQRSRDLLELHGKLGYIENSINHQFRRACTSGAEHNFDQVRQAQASDYATIKALHAHHFPSTWLSPQELVGRIGPSATVFVAPRVGTPYGYCLVSFQPKLHEAKVEYLAVVPEHRGCGLGRQLLQSAVEWASMAGAREIDLVVESGLANARSLYESAGFQLFVSGVAMDLELQNGVRQHA